MGKQRCRGVRDLTPVSPLPIPLPRSYTLTRSMLSPGCSFSSDMKQCPTSQGPGQDAVFPWPCPASGTEGPPCSLVPLVWPHSREVDFPSDPAQPRPSLARGEGWMAPFSLEVTGQVQTHPSKPLLPLWSWLPGQRACSGGSCPRRKRCSRWPASCCDLPAPSDKPGWIITWVFPTGSRAPCKACRLLATLSSTRDPSSSGTQASAGCLPASSHWDCVQQARVLCYEETGSEMLSNLPGLLQPTV